jgi:hypothetical protein
LALEGGPPLAGLPQLKFSTTAIYFMEPSSKNWPRMLSVGFLLLLLPGPSDRMFPAWVGNSPVLAAQNEPMNFTLEGEINKLEPGKLTVSTEENIIFHVSYNEQTDIKQADGTVGSAKDFRVGVRVKIEGDLTESGVIAAKKIAIQKETGANRPPPK